MTRLIKHIRRWNIWRKHSLNRPVYKALVLFGFIKSPTFYHCLLPEELDEILATFNKAVKGENDGIISTG